MATSPRSPREWYVGNNGARRRPAVCRQHLGSRRGYGRVKASKCADSLAAAVLSESAQARPSLAHSWMWADFEGLGIKMSVMRIVRAL